MKTYFPLCFIFLIQLSLVQNALAQQKLFNLEVSNDLRDAAMILNIAQDHQGYMWFGSMTRGLLRYDGSKIISFTNNPQNTNSIAGNWIETLWIDSLDIIWIGTRTGLDKYDPVENTFTHYKHNAKDGSSLSNDTVTAFLHDRSGNIWVGTRSGLNLLDQKTGKFTRYANKANDKNSLSYNDVRVLYEDRQGILWIGCGSAFASDGGKPEDGGLNKFNRRTGTFTRYLHDPGNPHSIANNKVEALFEDSKGNFWVGTAGDGLHTFDRMQGKFTHYYYDSTHPEKLSRPPIYNQENFALDHITFFHEDAKGFIWIGTFRGGINQYNPNTKKITHHGYVYKQNKRLPTDTLTGFKNNSPWYAFTSKDSLLWIAAYEEVYTVNPFPPRAIPYVATSEPAANAFYEEEDGSLWIGTNDGLIHKNVTTGVEKKFKHKPGNSNSLSNNTISSIQVDDAHQFWVGTDGGGLDKFDPGTQTFTHHQHDNLKKGSINSNFIYNLFFDHNKDLWIGTHDSGLNKLDIKTGFFTSYKHQVRDTNSLADNKIHQMFEDQKLDVWVGTHGGLSKLNRMTGTFRNYLVDRQINSLFRDKAGIIWAGNIDDLYWYNQKNDEFLVFIGNNGLTRINRVIDVIEDNQRNLWVSTTNAIYKISADRNTVRIFSSEYGVHRNTFGSANNYKTKSGRLLLGDQDGYYDFFPERITASSPPQITISSFQLGDKDVKYQEHGALNAPLYKAKEITLNYNQNSFSIGFWVIRYKSPREVTFQYMLENYDNVWHDARDERKAYFFSIPPGNYIFRVRAMSSDGVWSEKKLAVIISPPWWQRPWAIALFALSFIIIVWGFYYYRSQSLRKENRLLEEKVAHRTSQLQYSLEDLRSTQTQLIQAEKMASLGELTAGIAHEIQNPLNFINNFSEINKELVAELREEIDKGNVEDVKAIASDIEENEQKINHHGKRADAIVKGMLQHSRASSGKKEPTDLNALADEYLRLSYHGLRAKDKDFIAEFTTDFDESIGKIEVVPQDIGRVLLNLYNNAFYAASLAFKGGLNKTSMVWVSTIKEDDKVVIRVKDNGPGIAEKLVDKIFQPFFTTKPTGQGTGLGLSLSYDIIKAHGGDLKVESKEREGAEFIIQLPLV